jgi:mono-ADP-ribosyltransferase sirtuin 6
MASAQHLVFLTGAGISTSGGIPDFRGPTGIWTLEKKEKVKDEHQNKKQKLNCDSLSSNAVMDFSKAKPTLTHRAITKLASVGILKYCITQNVDGLHRRSGLSRNHHCALHGW